MENEELPTGHKFTDWEDVKRFAAFVMASSCVQECFNAPATIQVKSNGDRPFSEAEGPNIIWLANHHWVPSVILHEIAHLLVSDADEKEEHGPLFLKRYLFLLEQFLGKAHHDAYRAAFQREGLL